MASNSKNNGVTVKKLDNYEQSYTVLVRKPDKLIHYMRYDNLNYLKKDVSKIFTKNTKNDASLIKKLTEFPNTKWNSRAGGTFEQMNSVRVEERNIDVETESYLIPKKKIKEWTAREETSHWHDLDIEKE